MSFVAIIFVAFLAINFGPSSVLTDTEAGNNGGGYNSCRRGGNPRFQEKKGANVILSQDGRTAFKKDDSVVWYGGVITDRPLADDELFEVEIERTQPLRYSSAIGLTLTPPENIETIRFVMNNGNGTWALDYAAIYLDGEMISSGYPGNVANLKVGDRVGVVRKSDASIHFFLNGEDLGVAVKYAPSRLYGFFDVCNYVRQIRIIS